MSYGLQAAIWIISSAAAGLAARYLLNRGEDRQ